MPVYTLRVNDSIGSPLCKSTFISAFPCHLCKNFALFGSSKSHLDIKKII
jgi:hypothetical protein